MSTQVKIENIDPWSSLKMQIRETQQRLDFLRSLPTDCKLAVFHKRMGEGEDPTDRWFKPHKCDRCGRDAPDLWKATPLLIDAEYVVAKPIAECVQRIQELTKQMKELEITP